MRAPRVLIVDADNRLRESPVAYLEDDRMQVDAVA